MSTSEGTKKKREKKKGNSDEKKPITILDMFKFNKITKSMGNEIVVDP